MNGFDDKLCNEIAQGERWLASFATPAPSADAMAIAKQVVHNELARSREAHFKRSWRSWHGALAAAASLTLAVSIGWYSLRSYQPLGAGLHSDQSLTVWPGETEEESLRFAKLDDGLAELEAWSPERGLSLGEAAWDDGLDAAEDNDSNGEAEDEGASARPRSAISIEDAT